MPDASDCSLSGLLFKSTVPLLLMSKALPGAIIIPPLLLKVKLPAIVAPSPIVRLPLVTVTVSKLLVPINVTPALLLMVKSTSPEITAGLQLKKVWADDPLSVIKPTPTPVPGFWKIVPPV